MPNEEIYHDFIVREAGTTIDMATGRTSFEGVLEDRTGHRVVFTLTLKGCVGENRARAQYEAIAPLCEVGALWRCDVVYRRRSQGFVMCLNEVSRLQPIRLYDRKPITADEYFDSTRGYWVSSVCVGDWVSVPGVIELGGQSCIPVLGQNEPSFVRFDEHAEYGLACVKRPMKFVERLRAWFAILSY